MTEKKHVVIIGGGITGLSAAWELEEDPDQRARYTLLEEKPRWGGKVATRVVPGPEGGRFILDGGAESIVSRKPEAWQLAQEFGLEERVRDPGSETSGMYVLDDGVMRAIPMSPGAFFRSPLMSPRGKLRLLAEPFIQAKKDDEDETLAAFASRRLGEEAMRKFIAPVLAGIYSADPHRQSILTTSPIMREMEAESGSLFKALVARMRKGRSTANGAPKKPRFFTFKNGAGELIDHLVNNLSGTLRLNAPVSDISWDGERYTIHSPDLPPMSADAVILATPANVAAALLENIDSDTSMGLSEIRHTSIGTAFLVYRTDDLQLDQPVSGLMIPRTEGRKIDAVTFPFKKMPERAPEGFTAVRVFFGAGAPEMIDLPDAELQKEILAELADLLGINKAPQMFEVFRWKDSFPQADVGHLEKVQQIKSRLPAGIYLAGGAYAGHGVPDCVRQGRETAKQLLEDLETKALSIPVQAAVSTP